MPSLSEMVVALKQSGIREIMNLAMDMPDVIRLEVGEPLFRTPQHIVDAACRAAADGYTGYTANAGLPSLRKVIADRIGRDYGRPTSPDEVVVTVGGVGALCAALRALLDPGDEVLVPDPGWPNYHMIIRCAGGTPVAYLLRQEDDFLPNPATIGRLVTPRTKAIIVNSPSNPMGTVFPEALVEELVEFARRHDLFLVSDEVYEKMVFEGQHYSACSFDSDGRVISVFSASKTYAMTGWRVGYAVAPREVARQMAKLQEAYVSCAPSISQKAAEAALTGPQDCVEVMRRTYMQNLAVAEEVLDRKGIHYQKPKGAFYLWVDAGCDDSAAFAKRLLLEKKVAVAPGLTFGGSGRRFIRISLAARGEAIREGLTRLADALGKNQ